MRLIGVDDASSPFLPLASIMGDFPFGCFALLFDWAGASPDHPSQFSSFVGNIDFGCPADLTVRCLIDGVDIG